MKNKTMLEAKNICFSYNKKNMILDNISVSFATDEIVGLIGESGCGKSTLSRILSGYITPQKGEVLFDKEKLPKKGYCPVQLIYQHPEKAINPKWKMKKVIEEGYKISDEILKKLGIKQEWMNRWPSELSGGEMQRFCIARALGEKTKFIIADEMTTMLDAITQANIWHIITKECKNRAIGLIVVTHNIALAQKICDRIIYFDELK